MEAEAISFSTMTYLLGGIGLFLLGVHMLTEGLKIAAGRALKSILISSTQTHFRALVSGFTITSMVQSSSAVTVATIGFVNAGLLTLRQAVVVIFGSNIGSTMTGWLVALLGFRVDIEQLALPAVGIGTFLYLFSRNDQRAGYGQAVAGFGILFLGIDLLKSSFTNLDGVFDPQLLTSTGLEHLILFAAFGFLMTVLMQSSGAAMAITITAAASGAIPLEVAATIIIGANLGTTSTAAIAAIGATPNARRVAASHVLFNLITGAVAIITLPLWLWSIHHLGQIMEGSADIATLLALFHTLFNILGVLLMWPFTEKMVHFLQGRFKAAEEEESNPRYLDATLVSAPELAQHALHKEVSRIAALARRVAEDAISTEASTSRRLRHDREVMIRLTEAVGKFSARMRQEHLPEALANVLPSALGASRYFIDVADLAQWIDLAQAVSMPPLPPELEEELARFKSQAVTLLESTGSNDGKPDIELCDKATADLHSSYNGLKSKLLRAGTAGDLPVRHVVELIELMKMIDRMGKQMTKGCSELAAFAGASITPESNPEKPPEAPSEAADSPADQP